MKTIKIYCKTCHCKLTDDLFEENKNNISSIEGKDIVSKGKFAIINEKNINELVAHIDDYYLTNHSDSLRFQGCCGSSMFNSLNKTCQNGHEVATEISDCWTSHYIEFDLSKVIVKEKISDFEYRKYTI